MKKVSCIIPAYNEEKSIKNTLEIVCSLLGGVLYEVIVINDCSKDNTASIIKTFSQVIFIDNEINLGKSKSVYKGIEASSGDYIFLLDADLIGLNIQNISDIIKPILSGEAQVSFAFIKNSWPLFPFKKIDYTMGLRVISKSLGLEAIKNMGNLSGYGLEVFLNKLIIKNKLRIKVVKWLNVENDFHNNREGLKGYLRIIKIWKDVVFSAGGIINIYSMNIELEKLLIE